MRFIEQTFTNARIVLDYNEFERCTFITCTLVYNGNGGVGLVNSNIDNCQWVFEGPAGNTIQFMHGIYVAMGAGGRELMEATFESIRGKRPFGPPPNAPPASE